MNRADNSLSVLIGKSVARTASVQITDPSTTATYIASGEILVLDESGNVLTAGQTVSDTKSIKIVQGDGSSNPLVMTSMMKGMNITSVKNASYTAPQEEIQYIGYNGASGSIDLLNDNRYIIRIMYKHDVALFSEHAKILHQEYVSDSTATQSEIAAGFAQKYAQSYPATNLDVKVERVCDGTFTVWTNAVTAAVSYGSVTVTASAANHGVVAGNVVRIGNTLSTTGVYVVTAVSGVTITLDSAYQGASNATVANANLGVMSAITAWGLKFTGKPFTFTSATVGRFPYQKVNFDLTIAAFGATGITLGQNMSRGNGTFEEVAELEYFSLGFEGWTANRNAIPYTPQPRANATSGTIYNVITFKAYDSSDYSPVSGIRPSPFEVKLFLPVGASQTTQLKAQLNPWIASLPSSFNALTIV